MELIANEKTRKTTFQKRKKGLMKKAYEFSTLCDVDVCVILYTPDDLKVAKTESQLHTTWPSNPIEVKRIISKFDFINKHKPTKINACDVFDILSERKRRVAIDISKSRKAFYASKYPTWHEILNHYSNDQMGLLLNRLDSNIEALGRLIDFKKEVKEAIKTSTCLFSSNQNRVDFYKHQVLFHNPSYIQHPIHNFNRVLDHSDLNQTMPLTSGGDQTFNYDPTAPYIQHPIHSFNHVLDHMQLLPPSDLNQTMPLTSGGDLSFNYDPKAPGVLMGSAYMPMMLNNGATSTSDANQQYFGMLDSAVNYSQYPILPSISTQQMHDSEGNDSSYIYIN
uniref:MADS73 n=1 Tax=Hippophae rhamnoides TaxID=193516 RepID=A0AAU7LJK2_9ROSA